MIKIVVEYKNKYEMSNVVRTSHDDKGQLFRCFLPNLVIILFELIWTWHLTMKELHSFPDISTSNADCSSRSLIPQRQTNYGKFTETYDVFG